MAIRLFIHSRSKPGQGDAYAKAFLPIAVETQKEPGCEQYELYRSTQNENLFTLMERWKDQASLDAHMVVMKGRDMAKLGQFREGEVTRERYES
jgi:quinol monooxygenase YgiN